LAIRAICKVVRFLGDVTDATDHGAKDATNPHLVVRLIDSSLPTIAQ
jgi:hypothetical protein